MQTLTKSFALALIAGTLLAGTASTANARDGGGPERSYGCHSAHCQHVNKAAKMKKVRKAKVKKQRKVRNARSRPWASSYDPETGRRVTAIGNGDGTRTVIRTGIGVGLFGIQISISR